jgi:hypothetical protein
LRNQSSPAAAGAGIGRHVIATSQPLVASTGVGFAELEVLMSVKIVGVAAGVAGLLALGPQGSAPSWRIVESVRTAAVEEFTAVVATGKTSAWAFSGNELTLPPTPEAWERNGSRWTRESFPGQTNEEVVAAGATSPADVWAFANIGIKSRVLHYNGRRWSVAITFQDPIGGADVLGGHDVWVFGWNGVRQQLGVWHYNGHAWRRVGENIDGGSALSAANVWGFSGTSIDHYNGRTWSSTPISKLLPPKAPLTHPLVTGIYAQSAHSVYAVGNGNSNVQNAGGPLVVLHYNGRTWRKVAEGEYGYGTEPSQQIAPDGHGGFWLPMPGTVSASSYIVHYSGGTLTPAKLPVSATVINIVAVARIPGTSNVLAAGFRWVTHGSDAVILQYG